VEKLNGWLSLLVERNGSDLYVKVLQLQQARIAMPT
jgi:hypothetical protein